MKMKLHPANDPALTQCLGCGGHFPIIPGLGFFKTCEEHADDKYCHEDTNYCAGCQRSGCYFSKKQKKDYNAEDRRCETCQNEYWFHKKSLHEGVETLRDTLKSFPPKKRKEEQVGPICQFFADAASNYFWSQWNYDGDTPPSEVWALQKPGKRDKLELIETFQKAISGQVFENADLCAMLNKEQFLARLQGWCQLELAVVGYPKAPTKASSLFQSNNRKAVTDYICEVSTPKNEDDKDRRDRLWKIRNNLLRNKVFDEVFDFSNPKKIMTQEQLAEAVREKFLENYQNDDYFPEPKGKTKDFAQTWIAEILYQLLYSALGVGSNTLRTDLQREIRTDSTLFTAKAHELSGKLVMDLGLSDSCQKYLYKSLKKFADPSSSLAQVLRDEGESLATAGLITELLQKHFCADCEEKNGEIVAKIIESAELSKLLETAPVPLVLDQEEAGRLLKSYVEQQRGPPAGKATDLVVSGDFLKKDVLEFKKSAGTMEKLVEMMKVKGFEPNPERLRIRPNVVEHPSAYLYFGAHVQNPGKLMLASVLL
ncbi:unnamed protein product, partial [Amoebophrya sp. A120]|eukprot:GSA120T00011088001.1